MLKQLVLLLATLAIAPPLLAGTHKDPRIGYSLTVPRGWETIPVGASEPWIVAKFLADKDDHWTDPSSGWTWEHRSSLHVIAFLDEAIAQSYSSAEERGDEDPDVIDDYKEYMREAYSSGGFFFSSEEQIKFRGMDIECFEIKVKERGITGPRRLLTWVFPTEMGSIAVQIECLEDSFKKSKRTMERTMKSFKIIKRTESLKLEVAKSSWVSSVAMLAMPQDERNSLRQRMEVEQRSAALAGLPKDWTSKEIDGILVLNHTRGNFAKSAVQHINAITTWLEEAFPEVGEGEYVRKPILRVCKDWDEESAFREGSNGARYGDGLEIVVHKDSGSTSFEWEWINRNTMEHWFRERNRELFYTMPGWLRVGIREVVGTADVKGSKLRFKADRWQKQRLRDAVKDGAYSLQELLRMTNSDFFDLRGDERRAVWAQSAALVQYLLQGKGATAKSTRDLIPRYIANLEAVIQERKGATEDEDYTAPSNEEEEERMQDEMRLARKEGERELIERAMERTFAGWNRQKWSAFESGYRRAIH